MSANHLTCEIVHKVPFYDLDPMQIVWHGNYFQYFEDARVALFASRGIDLYEFYLRTKHIFPIVRTSTKHVHPLKYGDEFVCKATLIDGRMKIIIDFEIRLTGNQRLCARGRTEQVAVKAPQMEMLFSIPEEIRKALGF